MFMFISLREEGKPRFDKGGRYIQASCVISRNALEMFKLLLLKHVNGINIRCEACTCRLEKIEVANVAPLSQHIW